MLVTPHVVFVHGCVLACVQTMDVNDQLLSVAM